MLGGATGLLMALGALQVLQALGPAEVRGVDGLGLDLPVLAFAAAMSFLAALAAGTGPAMRATRVDIREALHAGNSPGSLRGRLTGALIVGQVALALVLLATSGLLLRSFVELLRVHPGFRSDRVAVLQVFMWGHYPQAQERIEYFRRAHEKLTAVAGVEAVGGVSALPFLGESSIAISVPIHIEGSPPTAEGEAPMVHSTVATTDYFRSMAIPLIRGRGFASSDTREAPRIALVNETMARRFWPGQDPVGRRFSILGRQPMVLEVAGVVGDVLHTGMDTAARPEFFRPFLQAPFGSLTFVVHTTRDPRSELPALKSALWEINNRIPFWSATTMEDLVSGTLAERRFIAMLIGLFSALALLLAAVGVYGIVSYATSRRTREMGVRLTLGAVPRDILALVLRQGLRLPGLGTGLGLLAAVGVSRLLTGHLFGVQPFDPVSYLAAAGLMGLAALCACYFPARRAARLDPAASLRHE